MAFSEKNHHGFAKDKAHPVKDWLEKPFAYLGEAVINGINTLGSATIFLMVGVIRVFSPKQIQKVVQQIYYIGARSTTIIILVSLFTGMVLGLQSYHALVQFGAQGALGTLVSLALIRELGPVLTAIMITARAGSAITAEIGMERITEQVDALKTMRIDPFSYIVSPRITASIISFPLLTTLFDMVGIVGGYVTGVILMGVNDGVYRHSILAYVDMKDITDGLVKAIVFAIIVATVCCYEGYYVHKRQDSKGAKAVGLATTSAVVISCVLILVSDYVVTSLLLL
jgi:phospholipid/cholesterol/gamma-HCH transport system permease protein